MYVVRIYGFFFSISLFLYIQVRQLFGCRYAYAFSFSFSFFIYCSNCVYTVLTWYIAPDPDAATMTPYYLLLYESLPHTLFRQVVGTTLRCICIGFSLSLSFFSFSFSSPHPSPLHASPYVTPGRDEAPAEYSTYYLTYYINFRRYMQDIPMHVYYICFRHDPADLDIVVDVRLGLSFEFYSWP